MSACGLSRYGPPQAHYATYDVQAQYLPQVMEAYLPLVPPSCEHLRRTRARRSATHHDSNRAQPHNKNNNMNTNKNKNKNKNKNNNKNSNNNDNNHNNNKEPKT